MKMTDQQYQEMVKAASKSSPKGKDTLWAFLVGGAICGLGQIMTDLFRKAGLTPSDASTWTTIALIFLSALLTGLRLYEKLAKHAGAGTLVPVTGFANSIVSPAMEFRTEGYITGMAAKMFQIAGPVLVFGIGSSVIYGLILCLLRG